jgi:class 3 adenylate cyclase
MISTISTILFTDIVNSSKHWQSDPEGMSRALDQHAKDVHDLAEKYDGFLLKTIGDAWMISFHEILNAVKFAAELQIGLILGKRKTDLHLRIGIATGPVEWKKMIIQKCPVIDPFGNTVGTASRMESRVSEPDGFAFAGPVADIATDILKVIIPFIWRESNHKIQTSLEIVDYKETCPPNSSGILETRFDVPTRTLCRDLTGLRGVAPVRAYRLSLSKVHSIDYEN